MNNLSLKVLEQIDCECEVISILDTSEYLHEAENPILRVFPPDFHQYVDLRFNIKGVTVIKSAHIKHNTLPGGLYKFVQSIKPNDKTEKEIYYLHVCPLKQEIVNQACNCNKDLSEYTDMLFELDLAQLMVNECEVKALEIYKQIKRKLCVQNV